MPYITTQEYATYVYKNIDKTLYELVKDWDLMYKTLEQWNIYLILTLWQHTSELAGLLDNNTTQIGHNGR